MIIEEVEDMAAALPAHAPVIGLDLGDKTIGVALSDTLLSIASPVETIRRKKFGIDADRLLQIIADRQVGGIVLGLPRNMDGSEGPRCQSTRAFARNLSRLTELPIGYWDERLSTVAAERALIEADTSRAKRAGKIDNVAASFILQGFLDRLRHLKGTA
ncbi:Putative Holliday junction resolvase [Thalassovita gelatinovora]|uniref:Putative pre-16S rRNA nuclease n=1 Tax=Thalassovita gelatinovora TaxID=53501 RepID=A0A0P1FUS2_THAGE|nr:Holliday junction resolvase RuvX [Thalassovita gelatinovora]QIZ79209.1 Holliday junction resolvase RuvX [Thalassovita gelatinovora]CUH63705.1 Putative Holliday junction resolvase [Thalassovita gelatinovora]SER01924.1 putative holliday junction resolvase [Thalassovita gelatinovora]